MLNKKLFLFSLLLSSAFAWPTLASSSSYRIKIDHVIDKRNVAITDPETNEKYLIHVENGCGNMTQGQTVQLILEGPLNGSRNDKIQVDSLHTCAIDQADFYTHRIYVDYTFRSNTIARVKDGNNNQFNITYSNSCEGIRNYTQNYIYTRQGSAQLSTSDQVILPFDEGRCSLSYVKPITSNFIFKAPTVSTANKRPNAVSGINAFARNSAVFLDWSAAYDDGGVDHYLIGVARGRINRNSLSADAFADLIKVSDGTSYTVTQLNNEQTYYFYLVAVDAQGLMSSDWSTAVSATPKSSILIERKESSKPPKMNVRVQSEANGSFVIKWDPIITADRYTVIFEVDGQREWVKTDYLQTTARILKRAHREGKTLKMTIRAFLSKDFAEEQSVEFEF